MAITKIATSDYIVAENHPSLTDIKNRAGKELHAKMTVEHDSDGRHVEFDRACFGEIDTFQGDGTSGRTITLTDTGLTPKFVHVWEHPNYTEVFMEAVSNGTFDSDITGWSSTYATLSWEDGLGYGGGGCLGIRNPSGQPNYRFTQSLTVVVGVTYTVSAWVRTKPGSNNYTGRLYIIEDSIETEIGYIGVGTMSTTWQKITNTYTPTHTTIMIEARSELNNLGQTMLWDDMSCSASTSITRELVTNGGFASDTSGWTVDPNGGAMASVGGGQSGNCLELTNSTTNLITNPAFSTDMTGWTLTELGGTVTGGNAGGQTGNCCSMNRTSAAGLQATQDVAFVGFFNNADYHFYLYSKSGTAGNVEGGIYLNSVWDYFNTSGSWVQQTVTWPAGTGSNVANDDQTFIVTFKHNATGSNGTMLFDTAALYPLAYVYQDVVTIPGRSYTVSFYAKSGTSAATVCSCWAGTNYIGDVALSGDWTQTSSSFTATAATTRIYLVKGDNSPGTVLFDTVSCQEDSLLQNFRIDVSPDVTGADAGHKGRKNAYSAAGVGTFATGSFKVSYAAGRAINTDGVTNYYIALGTHEAGTYTGDAGAGSNPNWVEDGQQMLGGTVGTEPANRVEKHIYDAFVHEHNDNGTHSTNPFAGTMKVETYNFTGTGSAQAVTLIDAALDIKELWVWQGGTSTDPVYSTVESMSQPAAKKEDAAAFVTNKITALGTGTFTFTGTNGVPYYYMALGV